MARMDLNDDSEKGNVETIFWSAMDMLSEDDKKLPQARIVLFLLFGSFSILAFEFLFSLILISIFVKIFFP